MSVPPKYTRSFDLGYVVCKASAAPAIYVGPVRPPVGDRIADEAAMAVDA